MLRLFAVSLLLFLAGCVTPQAGAQDDATAVLSEATTLRSSPLARQQAARQSFPAVSEVTPAGFTVMPQQSEPEPARPRPAIIRTSRPLQCVPYARELSKIALRGNAWTWWQKAKGQYERGAEPRPGAVLVLSKTRRLRLGHLAVVAEVLDERTIVVHHANWLNREWIHRYTPVRDISENNDWSVVRVWYTPGRTYGSRHYPAYGFIYPEQDDSPEFRQAAK